MEAPAACWPPAELRSSWLKEIRQRDRRQCPHPPPAPSVYTHHIHMCTNNPNQSPSPTSDRVFLCSPGCPGTHSADQAVLELRDPPASASQVLGLKASTILFRLKKIIFFLTQQSHCCRAGLGLGVRAQAEVGLEHYLSWSICGHSLLVFQVLLCHSEWLGV